MKKLLFIVITVLMLSFTACTEVTPEKVGEATAANAGVVETPVPVPTEAKTKVEVFKIGDIVQVGEVTFTVNGIKEIPGTDFIKPKEGSIWYAVDITAENKSSESVQMSSLMMFKLVDSDGYSYDLTIGPEVKGSMDGELVAGRKMRGEIPYEIPKDAKGLELEIDPSLWGNGKVIVKLDR